MDLSLTPSLCRVLMGVTCVLNLSFALFYRRKAGAARIIVIERRNITAHFIIKSVWGPCFYGVILGTLAAPAWMSWATIQEPPLLQWLGGALALGSQPFTVWTSRVLGPNLAGGLEVSLGRQLVTRGPYRRIRHPLYLAAAALLAGLGLLSANLLVAAVSAAGILLMKFVVIPREERTLAETFGKKFEAYRDRTGIWSPFQRRRPRSGRNPAWRSGPERRRQPKVREKSKRREVSSCKRQRISLRLLNSLCLRLPNKAIVDERRAALTGAETVRLPWFGGRPLERLVLDFSLPLGRLPD